MTRNSISLPTAFELTKYGDIPIDESRGKVNASIPLYNYNSGKLSLPITLIIVTSITDSKDNTTFFEYDNFNRLEFVKDNSGNIISENKYHYKGQPTM